MGKADDGRHIPLFHNRRSDRPKPAGDERKDDKQTRKETRVANAKKRDDD